MSGVERRNARPRSADTSHSSFTGHAYLDPYQALCQRYRCLLMANGWLQADDWQALSDDELTDRLRPQLRRLGLPFSDAELADVIRSREKTNVADWITRVLAR